MARIRSVKPEFWEDDAIGMLTRDARLLYIATWNMADDEGLLRWSPAYVKANAFMYDDDLSVEAVAGLMAELVDAGLLCPYIGGKARQSLAWIIQFARHQKPNRPQPSKLPPPSIQSGAVLQAYVRRDASTCHLCRNECSTDHDKRPLWPSLDHVKPRSEGGSDYPSNLLLSHQGCNKSRRDRPVESFSAPSSVRAAHSPNGSLNDSVSESVSGTLPLTSQEGLGVGGVGRSSPSSADDADAAFAAFWHLYPRKVGKQDARKVWDRKIKVATPEVITAGLHRYLPVFGELDDPRFIPHPSTWLQQGRWEDELTSAMSRPGFWGDDPA